MRTFYCFMLLTLFGTPLYAQVNNHPPVEESAYYKAYFSSLIKRLHAEITSEPKPPLDRCIKDFVDDPLGADVEIPTTACLDRVYKELVNKIQKDHKDTANIIVARAVQKAIGSGVSAQTQVQQFADTFDEVPVTGAVPLGDFTFEQSLLEGLTRFIVERGKAELVNTLFKDLERIISNNRVTEIFFSRTLEVIRTAERLSSGDLVTAFQSALHEDLNRLPTSIAQLDPQNENLQMFSLMAERLQEIKGGTDPIISLSNFSRLSQDQLPHRDLYTGLQVLGIAAREYYYSKTTLLEEQTAKMSLLTFIEKPDNREFFLAFFIAELKDKGITGLNADSQYDLVLLIQQIGKLQESIPKFKNVFSRVRNVNASSITGVYVNYIQEFTQTVKILKTFNVGANISEDRLQRLLDVLQEAANVEQALVEKDYARAVILALDLVTRFYTPSEDVALFYSIVKVIAERNASLDAILTEDVQQALRRFIERRGSKEVAALFELIVIIYEFKQPASSITLRRLDTIVKPLSEKVDALKQGAADIENLRATLTGLNVNEVASLRQVVQNVVTTAGNLETARNNLKTALEGNTKNLKAAYESVDEILALIQMAEAFGRETLELDVELARLIRDDQKTQAIITELIRIQTDTKKLTRAIEQFASGARVLAATIEELKGRAIVLAKELIQQFRSRLQKKTIECNRLDKAGQSILNLALELANADPAQVITILDGRTFKEDLIWASCLISQEEGKAIAIAFDLVALAITSKDDISNRQVTIGRKTENWIKQLKDHLLEGNFTEDFSEPLREALRFFSFVASLAEAQSPDDVYNVLETMAAPVGSFKAKRGPLPGGVPKFTLTVNSYLGLTGGIESIGRIRIKPGEGLHGGFTAPVGLELSLGHKRILFFKSTGLFLSALDLGTYVNFQAREDEVDSAPAYSFKQVFAPGIFLTFGISQRYPFTVGAGYQYVNDFRIKQETGGTDTESTTKLSAHRLSLFLAIDIPIWVFR